MVQGGQRLRLALEALQPLGVRGHLGRQDLQGHVAAELGVRRAINLAHAPAKRGGGGGGNRTLRGY